VIAICNVHLIPENARAKLLPAAREAGRPESVVVTGQVDITDLTSVQALHKHLAPAFNSRLDILVNNAAAMEPMSSILDADPHDYWKTWKVNVRGLLNMTRTFLPLLLSTNGLCTVINVASSGGLSARPNHSAYRTSKLAVMRWTESVQLDHAG
jgi:NAD(P)-dependent dehydrogenase (short-subunit alcohol dehydrogenase family)